MSAKHYNFESSSDSSSGWAPFTKQAINNKRLKISEPAVKSADIRLGYDVVDIKRGLSRIWEGEEESDCRYSESEEERSARNGHDDDVSSESSLEDAGAYYSLEATPHV